MNYATVATKKGDVSASCFFLRTRPTFSKSCYGTNHIFVEPAAEINGQYYRDVLLMLFAANDVQHCLRTDTGSEVDDGENAGKVCARS